MAQFIMLVGLPASGKSTYSKMFKLLGSNLHSSDSIREELTGSASNQSQNEDVFKLLHQRIKNDLQNGQDTVYDATNISRKRRIAFLKEIERYNAEKICFFIATPYAECLRRDASRESPVGEDVMQRMYKNFWIPQKYEGWDKISILWSSPIADNDINDILRTFEDYDQKTKYHQLSLGNHMESAYEYAYNQLINVYAHDPKDYENLLLAIRIHDIGKPFTANYDAKRERVTYFQHHLTGAYDALFYLRDLHNFKPIIHDYKGEPKNDIEILEISNYIQWHMFPYDIQQESTRTKFINFVGESFYINLMLAHEADKAAH